MEARVDRRASVTAMLPVTLMSWAAAMKRMNRGYVTALPSMFTVAPREHTNFASSAFARAPRQPVPFAPTRGAGRRRPRLTHLDAVVFDGAVDGHRQRRGRGRRAEGGHHRGRRVQVVGHGEGPVEDEEEGRVDDEDHRPGPQEADAAQHRGARHEALDV